MDVMQQLMDLPSQIASAEREANDLRQRIKDAERTLEMRQTDIVAGKPSKEWGANADDRKAAQAFAFRNDQTCQRLISGIAGDKYDLSNAEIEARRLQNVFYAVRTAADLLSAQLMAGQSLPSQGRHMAIQDRAAKYGV